jgi:hypothetical protein
MFYSPLLDDLQAEIKAVCQNLVDFVTDSLLES